MEWELVAYITFLIINNGYLAEEVKKDVSVNKNHNRIERTKPQTQSVSFKKVTYGGINGAYYTATTTRKSGSDGVRNLLISVVVLYSFESFFFLML